MYFILYRRHQIIETVSSFAVVKYLNVINDVAARIIARGVNVPLDTFALEQLKEAFSDRIIVAVATTTQADLQPSCVRMCVMSLTQASLGRATVNCGSGALRRQLKSPANYPSGDWGSIPPGSANHYPTERLPVAPRCGMLSSQTMPSSNARFLSSSARR